ncbi:DUF5958 family protein [Streptomyces sp. AK02-01A]|nr:DUF5958 family protein [Streptomyces sp. AK02-01A]
MLNELAQGLRPLSQGIEWFEGLPPEKQVDVLRLLCQYCVQARATTGDGPESIRRAGLRPTHTPARALHPGASSPWMLTRERDRGRLSRSLRHRSAPDGCDTRACQWRHG